MKRPYFKKSHDNGRQVRLGRTEDEAMTAWAALPGAAPAAPARQAAGLTLAELVKEWLAWVGKNKSKETLRSYAHYANTWAKFDEGKPSARGTIPAVKIRGYHVTKLCDEKFAVTDGNSDSVR